MSDINTLHEKLKSLRDDMKSYAGSEGQDKGRVLCEVGFEVLGGLEKAFDDFKNKSEDVWE